MHSFVHWIPDKQFSACVVGVAASNHMLLTTLFDSLALRSKNAILARLHAAQPSSHSIYPPPDTVGMKVEATSATAPSWR